MKPVTIDTFWGYLYIQRQFTHAQFKSRTRRIDYFRLAKDQIDDQQITNNIQFDRVGLNPYSRSVWTDEYDQEDKSAMLSS